MSQAYTFMTTGLDGVAIALMYCFYEIAVHEEIQTKAREEIIEKKNLRSGLSYDALKSMSYVENIINGKNSYCNVIIQLKFNVFQPFRSYFVQIMIQIQFHILSPFDSPP